jgi:hypothetical protein
MVARDLQRPDRLAALSCVRCTQAVVSRPAPACSGRSSRSSPAPLTTSGPPRAAWRSSSWRPGIQDRRHREPGLAGADDELGAGARCELLAQAVDVRAYGRLLQGQLGGDVRVLRRRLRSRDMDLLLSTPPVPRTNAHCRASRRRAAVQAGQGRLPRLTGAVDQHHTRVVERFRGKALGMAPNQIICELPCTTECHHHQDQWSLRLNTYGHVADRMMGIRTDDGPSITRAANS